MRFQSITCLCVLCLCGSLPALDDKLGSPMTLKQLQQPRDAQLQPQGKPGGDTEQRGKPIDVQPAAEPTPALRLRL